MRRWFGKACSAIGISLVAAGVLASSSSASTLPPSFQESVVFSGLSAPTVVRFAPDGRAFVAQKDGRIFVYDSLTDTTPTLFADLRTQVHDFWDRGMLGMVLDPGFPATPYVYVLYTRDATIGGTAPRWGDTCPTPPGPSTNGCVVSGRLSRLTAVGDVSTGDETVLIDGWCQQYPSHSVGTLQFGPDGALYVTAGDGASFDFVDYGQIGNPCGDAPLAAGVGLTPPAAEGGALRAQDVRTPGDPAGLSGAVLRVDPATGQGLPSNPLAASPDANTRRIIAFGLRNPFRAAFRPGTSELWIGDVGWRTHEEFNRLTVGAASVPNYGWPCFEGAGRQPGYDAANLTLCESLYSGGGATTPWGSYWHLAEILPNEACPYTPGSSISGIAWGPTQTSYPAAYVGALFFADYSRNCIWAIQKGADGLPSASKVVTFMAGGSGPVNLEVGPGGDLFYVGMNAGDVRRIRYMTGNQAPVAVAKATPTSGAAPLTVDFDGTSSSDPNPGTTLSYAWDLDDDGAFDDSTAAKPSWTYTVIGSVNARLRVTDPEGLSHTDTVVISVGNTKPTAVIAGPVEGTTWRVGQVMNFSGSATDPQQGTLPASALSWKLLLHHCPTGGCHIHEVQSWAGVASGSFAAPDHDYPSALELQLTATDAGGLTHTVSSVLPPRTVRIYVASSPAGMQVTLAGQTGPSVQSRKVIEGSANTISAPNQVFNGRSWVFDSWSDGGSQTHIITANASTTYTATFR